MVFAQKKLMPAVFLDSFSFTQYTGGVMVFEAKIGKGNHRPLHFILDTGSGGASIDSATALELGLKLIPTDTVVSGIAGANKVSYVFNQKFTVHNLVTDSMHFYVNDYSIISSVYGEKIDGIIGYSFLSRYLFFLDFDSSKIKVFSHGKYDYPSGGTLLKPIFNKLVQLPMEVKEKDRFIDNYYFDTGAGLNLLLTEDYVTNNNILLKKRKPLVTQIQGLGGKKRMRLTVVKRLKIGPYIFKQVPTNLYEDDGKVFNYPFVVGVLGNDIIRRFNVTLNYAAKEIYIKPNSNYNDDFDYAYTGLSLYSYEGRIVIDDIIEKSPAVDALLQNGDEVLGVGTNFSGIIRAYEKQLQKPSEKIKIMVSRNGKVLILEIKPVSIR